LENRIFDRITPTATDHASAIRRLEAGATPIAEMHTHNFGLEEAERAIRTLAREIPDEESSHSCPMLSDRGGRGSWMPFDDGSRSLATRGHWVPFLMA
jgi:hypothetical protein